MGGMKDHLKEGDGHGEEHPNVDHLDVRGDRQALGEAQETKRRKKYLKLKKYLHGCQDQKYGEVYLDDHVHVILSKESGSEADRDDEHGWNKHSQQIADNWSSKGDFNDNGLHFVDNSFTHT